MRIKCADKANPKGYLVASIKKKINFVNNPKKV